jgi:WD40 repeat protein
MGGVGGKAARRESKDGEEESGAGGPGMGASGDTLPVNHITRLLFLRGHTGPVRFLLPLSRQRVASGGDDGRVVIWSSFSGTALVSHVLHEMPVSALLLCGDRVVSGALDGSVRAVHVDSGAVWRFESESGHTGAVRALCALRGRVVSLGSDLRLCAWRADGTLDASAELQQCQETLRGALVVSGDLLVVSSDTQGLSSLAVYDGASLAFCGALPTCHREAVLALSVVGPLLFASASQDGLIALWRQRADSPRDIALERTFNYQHEYVERHLKRMLYPVSALAAFRTTALSRAYIVAAIGRGFAVFDASSGDAVLSCEEAHECTVTGLALLFQGSVLATAASDASVRLWFLQAEVEPHALAPPLQLPAQLHPYPAPQMAQSVAAPPSTPPPASGFSPRGGGAASFAGSPRGSASASASPRGSTPLAPTAPAVAATEASPKHSPASAAVSSAASVAGRRLRALGDVKAERLLIAELPCHRSEAQALVALDEDALATCGSDAYVVVFRDSRRLEKQWRNAARRWLQDYELAARSTAELPAVLLGPPQAHHAHSHSQPLPRADEQRAAPK